jgi:Reverse transcriptase (RNA-dependent DNA polymerase)
LVTYRACQLAAGQVHCFDLPSKWLPWTEVGAVHLFMHYAFDTWLSRTFPGVGFERYCDDAVIHCASRAQAEEVRSALGERLAQVGPELHPDKTRIVYCKDADRRGDHEATAFTFLGYTFRPGWRRTSGVSTS